MPRRYTKRRTRTKRRKGGGLSEMKAWAKRNFYEPATRLIRSKREITQKTGAFVEPINDDEATIIEKIEKEKVTENLMLYIIERKQSEIKKFQLDRLNNDKSRLQFDPDVIEQREQNLLKQIETVEHEIKLLTKNHSSRVHRIAELNLALTKLQTEHQYNLTQKKREEEHMKFKEALKEARKQAAEYVKSNDYSHFKKELNEQTLNEMQKIKEGAATKEV